MNLDRYITDEAMEAVWLAMDRDSYDRGWEADVVRAVVSVVYPLIRADVLESSRQG